MCTSALKYSTMLSLYLTPFVEFGTVSLTQYNLWVDKKRRDEYYLPYQRSGFGVGFGLGFKIPMLGASAAAEIGLEPTIFYTSSSGGDWNGDVFFYRRHSLMNMFMAVPVGISYSLVPNFSLYTGVRMLFGISKLSVYDSIHTSLGDFYTYDVTDASLSSSAGGMGITFGGDFNLGGKLAITARFGYDVLSFTNYEGEYEDRGSNFNPDRGRGYWLFDLDKNDMYVSDAVRPPRGSEIYAKEDLNGVRLKLGIKFLL